MTLPSKSTVKQCIAELADEFLKAGFNTPHLDARLLVEAVTGLSHARIIADGNRLMTTDQTGSLAKMVARHLKNEPVSRILNQREFYGRDFYINEHVLDPRADTETLVEQALSCIGLLATKGDDKTQIADLGTGSGAIAITLLAECDNITMTGIDISQPALTVAAFNARRHGVESRLDLVESDWLSNVTGTFDLVVSNPPYINKIAFETLDREVRDYDPVLALDGGTDGLDAYRQIALQAPARLNPGAFLIVETGFDQADSVVDLFKNAGFAEHDKIPAIAKDFSLNDRVVTLYWQ